MGLFVKWFRCGFSGLFGLSFLRLSFFQPMRSFIAMRGRPCFFFLFSKTKTSSVGGSAFRFPIRSLFSRTCSPEVVMALPQQQYTMIIHKTKTDSCCWYSSAIHQSLLLGHTPKRFFGDEVRFVCFVLFCFVLFCFVLFCFVLFCFVLFYFVLFILFVLFCCLSKPHLMFLLPSFSFPSQGFSFL